MPVKTRLTQFDSAIVLIQPLQSDLLGIVTAAHDVYLYHTQTASSEKFVHLNVPENGDLLCTFDPVHMRLLFGFKESRTLHLIDLKRKKAINRFELDQQSPTTISFSPDGAYFICGTDQGRVLLWRSDSSTLVSRLHWFPEYTSLYARPKNNFVSALRFEGKLLATSGYGGSVVVTDYMGQTFTKRYHPGTMRIQALHFFKHYVIIGNQEGTLIKIDRNGKQTNQRLPTRLGAINGFVQVGPEPYVLVLSEQRCLALIDAETFKMLNERYIELDDSLAAVGKTDSDELYIGTLSGELLHCDPLSTERLEGLIASKAYAQAYRHCEQEPLLKQSEPYRQLETIFETTLEKARNALEAKQTEEAKAMLMPFMTAKSSEIGNLLNAFAYFKRFTYLFENRKLAPFYGLAEHYPPLQKTALYRQAEKMWEERFTKAQKMMLLGKPKEAQSEVEPFSLISAKRPLIELLIHRIDVFKSYSKAIQKRDYSALNQLIQRYPVLRRLPSYVQLIEEKGELSSAILEALKSKSFEQAQLYLTQLSGIAQYEEHYGSLKEFAAKAENLAHAIEHTHLRSAYGLLDAHPSLTTLPWAAELEEQWHQKVLRCECFAAKGDILSIKKELGRLITLQGRHERIGDILRMAYQVQLKGLLRKNPERLNAGVNDYCNYFGMDTELRHLLKKARRLKIDIDLDPLSLHPKKRDHWLTYAAQLPNSLPESDTLSP